MKQLSPPPTESERTPSQVTPLQQPVQWVQAFWKFSRPHTIAGTTLSVLALWVMALTNGPAAAIGSQPTNTLFPLLFALLACLGGNIYIVGLNQIEDVEIDRINKPDLPIAAGAFSRQQAIAIVAIAGILSVFVAGSQGPYLLGLVTISLSIGTLYSLPPIRLKRFPLLASLCILTVRGVVVNVGLFLHFNAIRWTGSATASAGAAWPASLFAIPPQVWALTGFILVFTFAIAIFKDIPDAEGDRQYDIATFTLTLGQQTVFNLARWVITACYLGMAIAGLLGLPNVNPVALIATHLLLLTLFWARSLSVDLGDRTAIRDFYQFIWKLFFLEYILFPLSSLL